MRSKLSPTLVMGLAGLLSLAAACGDDTSTTGAGGAGGTSGDGGASASTGNPGPAGPGSTATSSSGNPTSTSTGVNPQGTGGDPSGTGGDPSGTGGDPSGTGGDPSGTGGDPTGTGGSPAGTGGETGSGGSPAGTGGGNPGCTAITLDEFINLDGANDYGDESITPNLDGGVDDLFDLGFYDTDYNGDPVDPAGSAAGTYDLSDEPSYFDCARCIIAFVNPDPDTGEAEKLYFQQSGSLTLDDAGNNVLGGRASFTLSDVVLAEATIDFETGDTAFVNNGECLYLAAAEFDDPAPVVPGEWVCADSDYTDAACDCGCGALDPACTDATSASCATCPASGCANDGESSFGCDDSVIDPDSNFECIAGTTSSVSSTSSTGGGGDDFTVDSGVINVAIPDDVDVGDGLDIDFNSAATGNIASINSVVLTLNHTWAGDVYAVLVSPGGDIVELIVNPTSGGGLASANFASSNPITFDDSAVTSNALIGTGLGTDAVVGAAAPSSFNTGGGLGDLVGGSVNGTWTLYVEDNGFGDTGNVTHVVVNGSLE